jgi:biotin synthase-related radical SAM superfamily protein
MQNKPIEKKATLILGGPVKVPSDMELPCRLSCSTAGPGAGSTSVVLAFEGMRVKKAVSRKNGEFELIPKENGRYLLRNKDEVFIEDLEVQPVVFHAPEQAFFNLNNECIFGCIFCASPLLEGSFKKDRSPGEVVEMILDSQREKGFGAVAITSGVPDTPEMTLDRMIQVISEVRKALPTINIGVEPYISDLEQIDALKRAGADEIKINIETFDPDIFAKVCPRKDYNLILRSIEHAARIFGPGKVTSNIIIGLGEDDSNVLEGIEQLACLGCISTIRALRTSGINRTNLSKAIGEVQPVDKERLLRLARSQKEILEKHGLSTETFRTMCPQCGCCDIVPFKDIE